MPHDFIISRFQPLFFSAFLSLSFAVNCFIIETYNPVLIFKDENIDDASARQYPTSSRKHHDWDKLAAEIEKDESEEKKEGDAALNELFQKIYANADEDTKRAMNKSYQESGGTVLSTNWKDIGKKKVECKPPDGMEFKKYEL